MSEDDSSTTSQYNRDFRPIPDPTVLTNEAVSQAKDDLRREMLAIQALFAKEIEALWRRVELNTERLSHIHGEIVEEVAHLKELHRGLAEERFRSLGLILDERFHALQTEITIRNEHVQQAAKEVKENMATTLSATSKLADQQTTAFHEAANKSEVSFRTQIGALDNKINVLADLTKSSMTREEIQQLVRSFSEKIDGPTGLAMRFENLVARTVTAEDVSRRNIGNNQWAIGALLGGLALLMSTIFGVLSYITHGK